MGTWETFLYRPAYGAQGLAEYTEFDSGLLSADEELQQGYSHRTGVGDVHTQYAMIDGTKDFTGMLSGTDIFLTGGLEATADVNADSVGANMVIGTILGAFNYVGSLGSMWTLGPFEALSGYFYNNLEVGDMMSAVGDIYGEHFYGTWAGTADHGALSGLGDDDHTIYMKADGTRSFTAEVSGNEAFFSGTIECSDLSASGYVYGTWQGTADHGALSGLGDDDHTIYAKADSTRAFTGLTSGANAYFSGNISAANLYGNVFGIDHGGLSGLTDDDHTIYMKADGTRAFTDEMSGTSAYFSQGLCATTISASNIYGIWNGTADHGALSGLGDDDHTQYSLADGTKAFIGMLSGTTAYFSGAVSGATPTNSLHFATKAYADALVVGGHDPVTVADSTTINLTLGAAQELSGDIIAGGIDHGALSGIGDDDHTIYMKADGTRAFTDEMSGTSAYFSQGLCASVLSGSYIYGVYDHGALSGLSDNDHPQYPLTTYVWDHGTGLSGLSDNDHPQYPLTTYVWDHNAATSGEATGDVHTQYSLATGARAYSGMLSGTSGYFSATVSGQTPTKNNELTTKAYADGAGHADVQTFTTTGTANWTKPSGKTWCLVKLWGAGGSGGEASTGGGGGGGGGGSYHEWTFAIADLSDPVVVTVGAGGPATTGAGNGTAGENTTFGSYLTAYGGGYGVGGGAAGGGAGGGGGTTSIGANAATSTGGDGGGPMGGTDSTVNTSTSIFGGGCGGDGGATPVAGSQSVYGGGGAGGGGADTVSAVGGASVWGGGGGGGGCDGGAGGEGGTSIHGGAGGAGATGVANATAGTQPGGGGGGCETGASGKGGDGKAVIISY